MSRIFRSNLLRRTTFAFFTVFMMMSLFSTSLVFAANSSFSTSTHYDSQVAASQINVQDVDVSFDDTRPEPHVCRFIIEGTGYAAGSKGTWSISGQSPIPSNVSASGDWGPIGSGGSGVQGRVFSSLDADGNWHTEVISGLANGRYKLDVVNSAGGTTEKFFWVDCAIPGGAVANISSNAACPQGFAIIKDHTVIQMIPTQGKAFIEFTLAPNCFDVTLSLVSYMAPNANFSRDTASQQVLFAATTGSFSSDVNSGKHRMEVAVPSCFWQLNFVFGQPIVNLGPAASSNFYQDQGRLIAGSEGGFTPCITTAPVSQPIPTATVPPIAGVPSTGGSDPGDFSGMALLLAMAITGVAALGVGIRTSRRIRG